MGRRKARGSNDELALIRAAAWAWYQHGSSGSQEKPMREYDITRIRSAYRPSRYRIEATVIMANEEHQHQHAATAAAAASRERSSNSGSQSQSQISPAPPSPTVIHTDSSLLDPYEVQMMVTSRLDQYYLDSAGKFVTSDFHGTSPCTDSLVAGAGRPRRHRRKHNYSNSLSSSPEGCVKSSTEKLEKKRSFSFWLWRRRAVICAGRRADVVDNSTIYRRSALDPGHVYEN